MTAFIFITVVVVLCVLVYRNTEPGFTPSQRASAISEEDDLSPISPFILRNSLSDIDVDIDLD